MLSHGRSYALKLNRIHVTWDADYGIDHRHGWSVVLDGKVLSQLEPWFIVAAWKAWKMWRLWE